MTELSVASRRRIEAFRKRIGGLTKNEGIELTAEERAFLELLDEERVPHELRTELATAIALQAEDRTAAAD